MRFIVLFLFTLLISTSLWSKTHYEILGVSPSSTDKEIKTAFRRAANLFHPDKKNNWEGKLTPAQAQAKFIQVKESYDLLRDPIKRKAYNQTLKTVKPSPAWRPFSPDNFVKKAQQEKAARDKAAAVARAKAKAAQEKAAKLKAEQERLAKIKAEQERLAKIKAEQERLAKVKAEAEAKARAKAQASPTYDRPRKMGVAAGIGGVTATGYKGPCGSARALKAFDAYLDNAIGKPRAGQVIDIQI